MDAGQKHRVETQDCVVANINMTGSRIIKDIIPMADILSQVNPVARSVNSRPVNIKKTQAVKKVDDQSPDDLEGKKQNLPDVHDINSSPPNASSIL
jgi:hypothetical protein